MLECTGIGIMRHSLRRTLSIGTMIGRALAAAKNALCVEYGICGLASDPVDITIELVNNPRRRQPVQPFAQHALVLYSGIDFSKSSGFELGKSGFELESVPWPKISLRGA